jgi:hypothetical protein
LCARGRLGSRLRCRLVVEVEYGASLEVVEPILESIDSIVTDVEREQNESVKEADDDKDPVINHSYGWWELGGELGVCIEPFAEEYRISVSEHFLNSVGRHGGTVCGVIGVC